MIYTVTFNPSLDYIVTVDDFTLGKVNRTKKEIVYPGGKGINVSMVLENLGHKSCALGFMAGFTGEEIARSLKEKGISSDFIHVKRGMSRIKALPSPLFAIFGIRQPMLISKKSQPLCASAKTAACAIICGSFPKICAPQRAFSFLRSRERLFLS